MMLIIKEIVLNVNAINSPSNQLASGAGHRSLFSAFSLNSRHRQLQITLAPSLSYWLSSMKCMRAIYAILRVRYRLSACVVSMIHCTLGTQHLLKWHVHCFVYKSPKLGISGGYGETAVCKNFQHKKIVKKKHQSAWRIRNSPHAVGRPLTPIDLTCSYFQYNIKYIGSKNQKYARVLGADVETSTMSVRPSQREGTTILTACLTLTSCKCEKITSESIIHYKRFYTSAPLKLHLSV